MILQIRDFSDLSLIFSSSRKRKKCMGITPAFPTQTTDELHPARATQATIMNPFSYTRTLVIELMKICQKLEGIKKKEEGERPSRRAGFVWQVISQSVVTWRSTLFRALNAQ